MFSSRVPLDRTPNRLHLTIERLRAAGEPLIDLTLSNPTTAGIEYPADLLAGLASSDGLRYEPSPLGLRPAREAVARALTLPADRVILTASTSDAYSLLFKLLCDPGDDVLVPRPSYPLFEFLAPLDGVHAAPYALDAHGAWGIDLDAVRDAVTPRTRAILVVNPNNPTGSYLRRRDLDALAAFSAERGIAIVGDEVFYDFPLGVNGVPADAARTIDQDAAIAFSLGGLSKSAGLPQLKLGWMALSGPPRLVSDARDRLEIICDAYLPVATPVQLAAPALLRAGEAIRARILERLRANHDRLAREVARHPSIRVLPVEGGWYAILQVPALRSEDDLALDLLERDRVIVHPGYFFDFPREAFLVVSLLPPPDAFADGVRRVVARVATG
ncbi:MAG: pyridoxal phosphate-dependent aminotransferase [Vicinamibacterales bacterium]